MAELNNADFVEIINEYETLNIAPDDILLVRKVTDGPHAGKTAGIRGVNLIPGATDLTSYQWVSTQNYDTGDAALYANKWWESLQDGNLGNLPSEGALWTQVNKVTASSLKKWSPGMYVEADVYVVYNLILFELNAAPDTPRPFNSVSNPLLDSENWTAITAGENSTGLVKLDKIGGRSYGEANPLTGPIDFDLSDSIIGGCATMEHNDDTEPDINTSLNQYIIGTYEPNVLNVFWFCRVAESTMAINITQPTYIAGVDDLTNPEIISAVIQNTIPNQLLVEYSRRVNVNDVLGQSISGDQVITVDSIISGLGTTFITYEISPDAIQGSELVLNVSSDNSVHDLSVNANPLLPVNFNITNNTGVLLPLSTPTNFIAFDVGDQFLTLSWDPVVDAENYIVLRGLLPDFSDGVQIYSGANPTFDDSGLTVNTTYYYQVKAQDIDGIYSDSAFATLSQTTQYTVPIINVEHLWHKLDIATTGVSGANVVSSTDSLTDTPYPMVDIDGFVSPIRSTLDSKECVEFTGGGLTTSNSAQILFNQSFSISMQIAPNDGNPASPQILAQSYDGTANNRVLIQLSSDGKLVFYLGANGTSLFATTVNPVFADGAAAVFTSIIYTVESEGVLKLYVNGVDTALDLSDLSTIDLSTFTLTDNFRVGIRKTSTSFDLPFLGKMRMLVIQPVIYTQDHVDYIASL